ncbi:hypothetical protein CHS0354_003640 [Potamilus streckersoni]|uniref:Uncharacterized protein n=1 Tax=Potamilus streckersoni TaxID=2493646 RepID=A0AAE0S8Q7_9BIVA|nr:hypothetical protein CHS0354_003640 [Potamilus streckersoni]
MSANNQAEDAVDGFLGLQGKGHYCPRDLEIQTWGSGGPSEETCDSTDSQDILSILMRTTTPSLWRHGLRKMLKVDKEFQIVVINFLKDFTRQSISALERGLDVRVDVDFDSIIAEKVEYTDFQDVLKGLNLKTSSAEAGNTLEAFQSLLESMSVLQTRTLSKLISMDDSDGLKLYQSQCCSHDGLGENLKTLQATFLDINSDNCKTVIKCLFGTIDTPVTYV